VIYTALWIRAVAQDLPRAASTSGRPSNGSNPNRSEITVECCGAYDGRGDPSSHVRARPYETRSREIAAKDDSVCVPLAHAHPHSGEDQRIRRERLGVAWIVGSWRYVRAASVARAPHVANLPCTTHRMCTPCAWLSHLQTNHGRFLGRSPNSTVVHEH